MPVKAQKSVLRKYDPDYNTFGLTMAGSVALTNAVR